MRRHDFLSFILLIPDRIYTLTLSLSKYRDKKDDGCRAVNASWFCVHRWTKLVLCSVYLEVKRICFVSRGQLTGRFQASFVRIPHHRLFLLGVSCQRCRVWDRARQFSHPHLKENSWCGAGSTIRWELTIPNAYSIYGAGMTPRRSKFCDAEDNK